MLDRTVAEKRSLVRLVRLDGLELEVFCNYIAPPIGLVIFDSGDDVKPLIAIAHALRWRVTIVEVRQPTGQRHNLLQSGTVIALSPAAPLRAQISLGPFDAAVIITLSYHLDSQLLRELLPMRPEYLGVLGARNRTLRLLDELAVSHILGDTTSNLRSPAGLLLGGEGPEAIALSIAAEIQTKLGGKKSMRHPSEQNSPDSSLTRTSTEQVPICE
jgi:xanthine dehydrogenase accessory factor